MEDILLAYIAGMDTFALGFRLAMKLIEDGRIDKFIEDRYSSYTRGIGKEIVDGNVTLEQLSDYAMGLENVEVESGRQEYLEAIVNNVIFSK
jgi:xylose isomerase